MFFSLETDYVSMVQAAGWQGLVKGEVAEKYLYEIRKDADRTCYVDFGGTVTQLKEALWQEARVLARRHEAGEAVICSYAQGDFSGGLATTFYQLSYKKVLKRVERYNTTNEQQPLSPPHLKNIMFAYRDKDGNLCGFGLAYVTPLLNERLERIEEQHQKPEWVITVTRNTTQQPQDRTVFCFSSVHFFQQLVSGDDGSFIEQLKQAINHDKVASLIEPLFEGTNLITEKAEKLSDRIIANHNLDDRDRKNVLLQDYFCVIDKLSPKNKSLSATKLRQLKTIIEKLSIDDDGRFYEKEYFDKQIKKLEEAIKKQSSLKEWYECMTSMHAVEEAIAKESNVEKRKEMQVIVDNYRAELFTLPSPPAELIQRQVASGAHGSIKKRNRQEYKERKARLLDQQHSFSSDTAVMDAIKALPSALGSDSHHLLHLQICSNFILEPENKNNRDNLFAMVRDIESDSPFKPLAQALLPHAYRFSCHAMLTSLREKKWISDGNDTGLGEVNVEALENDELATFHRDLKACYNFSEEKIGTSVILGNYSKLQEKLEGNTCTPLAIKMQAESPQRAYQAIREDFKKALEQSSSAEAKKAGQQVLASAESLAKPDHFVELTNVLCSCNRALNDPEPFVVRELADFSKTVSGRASPAWRKLGLGLALFACAIMVAAGILAAIPSGGSSLLLTTLGAAGIPMLAANISAGATGALALTGFGLFAGKRKKGLAKRLSSFEKAIRNNEKTPGSGFSLEEEEREAVDSRRGETDQTTPSTYDSYDTPPEGIPPSNAS